MKIILLFTTLVITLLIPLRIKAVSISSSSIEGEKAQSIGQPFTLSFKINFSEFQKNSGIAVLAFEIEYDDKDFAIIGVETPILKSDARIEDGTKYIISQIDESNPILYYGDYKVDVTFFVMNTQEKTSTIKMGAIEVGILDITNIDNPKEIYLEGMANKNHTVTINSPIKEDFEPPKTIVSKGETDIKKKVQEAKKETNINTTEKTSKPQTTLKSSDATLKSLEIENYKINFRKSKKEYTVYIDEGVNSLNIKAETYDSKAKYKVIGAEDLKANNNKVSIEVTAEDNTKETYILNIKIDGELKKKMQEKMTKKDTPKEKEKNTSKLDKKTLTKIGIITGLIALIGVVSFIIYKIKNRKMDKILDEL